MYDVLLCGGYVHAQFVGMKVSFRSGLCTHTGRSRQHTAGLGKHYVDSLPGPRSSFFPWNQVSISV